MSSQINIATTFYVQACPRVGCGVMFGIEDEYDDQRRADAGSFYCPNGHSMSYGKSEADKLREKLAAVERMHAMAQTTITHLSDQCEAAERSARAQRAANTRLRRRVADGVCPCCQRSFANLARHMAGQHPDYATDGTAVGTTDGASAAVEH